MGPKIYTRTGDQGESSLFSGERVSKNHPRLMAYGDIDELNSAIGLLLSHWQNPAFTYAHDLRGELVHIQNQLFHLGSFLATTKEPLPSQLPPLDQDLPSRWEKEMDRMSKSLPPLKNFILPGGSLSASYSHLCRTLCRRAERSLVSLSTESPVNPTILQTLNRLSDFFFVLARYANHCEQVQDQIWKK